MYPMSIPPETTAAAIAAPLTMVCTSPSSPALARNPMSRAYAASQPDSSGIVAMRSVTVACARTRPPSAPNATPAKSIVGACRRTASGYALAEEGEQFRAFRHDAEFFEAPALHLIERAVVVHRHEEREDLDAPCFLRVLFEFGNDVWGEIRRRLGTHPDRIDHRDLGPVGRLGVLVAVCELEDQLA